MPRERGRSRTEVRRRRSIGVELGFAEFAGATDGDEIVAQVDRCEPPGRARLVLARAWTTGLVMPVARIAEQAARARGARARGRCAGGGRDPGSRAATSADDMSPSPPEVAAREGGMGRCGSCATGASSLAARLPRLTSLRELRLPRERVLQAEEPAVPGCRTPNDPVHGDGAPDRLSHDVAGSSSCPAAAREWRIGRQTCGDHRRASRS